MSTLPGSSLPLLDGGPLTVDGLEVRVRISARRRRFALTVESDATATLHVPAGRPATEAEAFVRAHRTWLASRQAARERTRPLNPPKQLLDGEVFRYLGRTCRLSVVTDERRTHRVRLVAGRLVMSRELAGDPVRGRAALTEWYCRVGRAWAAGRLQPWAARMEVAEPALDVRDLGGRWGTYEPGTGDGRPGVMRLGWQLFQLPMHVIDYVIAHELAHVRIPGHGQDFWRLLGSALPEYDERRSELAELGRRLWMGEVGHPAAGG
ncbi:SprT family zinc-dependent metalloprotease [Streptomyces sp. DSM 44917]|uniref:SprT family zinc-dependent metalloprotease n=1 Tax=Streptomyces boetiae TaxID=3075541 RepID=A0ABU2LFD8_9ACTN|nr:SprT family zinc-dependent metalloprotease [Streptomyces sp. DSM 44917]MDT0310300.1 SprT family zinc-dependent metalloprotease [Streptomyces sp. DSM 44917]